MSVVHTDALFNIAGIVHSFKWAFQLSPAITLTSNLVAVICTIVLFRGHKASALALSVDLLLLARI